MAEEDGLCVFLSVRPTDARTANSRKKSARRRHKVGPFAAPLSPLDCAALSLGGESKAFAERGLFRVRVRSLARSLDGRPAGRSGRALQSYLCTVMNAGRDSQEDRHVMRLNELSPDLLCEALGKDIIENWRHWAKLQRAH